MPFAQKRTRAALRAGASGFVLKDTPPDELVGAISVIASGESLLAPSVTRRLIQEFSRTPPSQRAAPPTVEELTPRELEVFKLLARGMSGQFSRRHHVAVEAVHYYWHFVDVVWIVLFLTIYVIK